MKKCDYCANEISYHEMYCDDDCQRYANDFYELRERFSKLFSIINGICVLSIGVFIFMYSFLPKAGLFGAASALTILGILYFIFPFPPEVMMSKYKIKKSIKICRVIAAALFFLGMIAFTVGIIFY